MKKYFAIMLFCLTAFCLMFTGCEKGGNEPDGTEQAELKFRIEITNITRTTADVMITPEPVRTKYLYFIIDKAQYDELGSDEALLEKSRQELVKRAEQRKQTLAQLVESIRRLGAFAEPERFLGLETSTSYYIYAYGVNDEGEAVSDITKQEFTTEGVQMVDCLFSFKITTTRTSIGIEVAPTDKKQWYYYQLLTEEQFNSYGGTAEKAARAVIDKQLEAWQALGNTMAEAVASMALKGDHSYNFTGLTPDTPYYIFICGINDDGDICTKVEDLRISTKKFEPSDNSFIIYPSGITCDSITIEITPDNDDPYLAVVKPQSEIAGKDAESIMAAVVAEMGDYVGKYAKRGKQTVVCNRTLMPETDYSILVFGYDGGVTTVLTRVNFTTAKASTSGDAVTFAFSFTNKGYIITPSDETALYLQGTISADNYETKYNADPAKIKGLVKEYIDLFVPDIFSMEEFLQSDGKRGTYTDDDFNKGTLYVYAICVNADGTFAGEPFVSEKHTF